MNAVKVNNVAYVFNVEPAIVPIGSSNCKLMVTTEKPIGLGGTVETRNLITVTGKCNGGPIGTKKTFTIDSEVHTIDVGFDAGNTAGVFSVSWTGENGINSGETRTADVITVVELVSLQVTDARIGSGKDNYIAAVGSGNVSIKATLNPNLKAADLPEALVTWDGGEIGADQLHRLVSKSKTARVKVTAKCGDYSSKSVTIYIIHVDSVDLYYGSKVVSFPGGVASQSLPWTGGMALEIKKNEKGAAFVTCKSMISPDSIVGFSGAQDPIHIFDNDTKWFPTYASPSGDNNRLYDLWSWENSWVLPDSHGGLYKFQFALMGSVTECQISLPMAQAEISNWVLVATAQAYRQGRDDYKTVLHIFDGDGFAQEFALWDFYAKASSTFDCHIWAVNKDKTAPCPTYESQETGKNAINYGAVTVKGVVVNAEVINYYLWAAYSAGYGASKTTVVAGGALWKPIVKNEEFGWNLVAAVSTGFESASKFGDGTSNPFTQAEIALDSNIRVMQNADKDSDLDILWPCADEYDSASSDVSLPTKQNGWARPEDYNRE